MLLLGEPFTFPADVLLEQLNEEHPGVPVIGGMAGGGHRQGEIRLLFRRGEVRQGAVAVLLSARFGYGRLFRRDAGRSASRLSLPRPSGISSTSWAASRRWRCSKSCLPRSALPISR